MDRFDFGIIVDQQEICWNKEKVGSLQVRKLFLGMWKEPWLWERPPFEFGKVHSIKEKFGSLRTEKNTKPFDASLWKIGSLPSSGKKIPGSLRGTQRKVGSPQGTQEWADPFVEGRKRNSKQPFDEANGKLLPSSGKKTPASLPRKRKRGKNRSLPPRHRASTFSLLFLPFPPHFLPKLPSGGLTNPLRKNKILPPRSSPPLAESSICTHTEIL